MSAARSPQALRERDHGVSLVAQQTFERPCVVEAGAGTGKTTLLVARCLAWSLGPGWERAERRIGAGDPDATAGEVLSRVAAITFTEAAAAEMAQRLGQVLTEVAAGKLRAGIAEQALPPGPELRAQRARALLGALDHWVVRTIHAFCRRLLARHALAAGLHPEFQVDAEGRVSRAVAREVVEAAVREGYGEPGDPDLIALGVDGFGPPELEEALLAFMNEAVEPEALAEPAFSPERVASLLAELRAGLERFAAADRGRLGRVRKGRITGEVMECIDATAQQLLGSRADLDWLDDCAERLRSLWSESALPRLRKWGEGGFNTSETSGVGDAAPAVAEAARELCLVVERIVSLRPLRLERARRVLHGLLGHARERMRERGAISFAGLLREARALLRDQPAVRERVRAEFDQLLIDEFQDTDPVQCDVVRLLALAPGAGSRPGLFLVGDPKQSIYGWRAADLRAYAALVGEALGPGVSPELLCVNRRSLPAILAEVERVVAPLMAEASEDQAVFQPLVASEERERGAQEPPAQPRAVVEHWVSWGWDGEAGGPRLLRAAEAARLEAAAVARDLAALKQTPGFEWKHAGLLMRTWSDLEIYLAALREAGIPYAVEGGRSYRQRREVIDASALVRCVLDPNDHLALLAWLRSPSVGVPDAALIPLWTRDFPRRVSALAGPAPAPLAEIEREIEAARAELPHGIPGLDRIAGWERSLAFAVAGIAQLRASFATDAVDLFVEKLRSVTLIDATEAARFPGAFRLANLDRFFRELRAELEAEEADVQGLLRRLRADAEEEPDRADARPELAAQDAVQVMTIHGAKGLEFRHCYLVQLHKGSGAPPTGAPKPVVKELEGCWEYRVFGAPTPGFAELEEREQRVAEAERVRALYVAMTRARDRLVLLGAWPLAVGGRPGRGEALIELLRSRREPPASLPDAMARAQTEGRDGEQGANGVRWSFPDLRPAPAAPRSPERGEAGRVDLSDFEADLRALGAAREAALRRMQRPFRAPASADAHADERERRAAPQLAAARETAAAAGTAVHGVLEELSLDGELREALERASAGLGARIDARGAGGEAALASARQTLARFADGPLLARLAAVRGGVIARELAVLLPADPEGEGPVGFVAGSIDLLYRDPESDQLVVVDYKTDRVEGEAALRERAERYRGQARHYRRAVREALQLDAAPRFELWFLHAGRVVPVD